MDQSTVLSLAKAYADAVRSVMKTAGVFLYGSQARGTATRDSEIGRAHV